MPPPVRPPDPPPPPPAVAPAQPEHDDGPSYQVSSFNFRYPQEHPDRPPMEDLLWLPVTLGQDGEVYVAPRAGVPSVTLPIKDLTAAQRARRRFSVSALNAIGQVIVAELNSRGIIGVLVAPDPEQIDPQTLEDLRPPTERTLTVDIWIRTIRELRTLGAGARWTQPGASGTAPGVETRINHPLHDRVRAGSPLQPGHMLRKDLLDDFLFRLDRQPGRRVDAAISATDTPGEVYLDYIITENRPWTVYFQLSNTGTKQTEEWRERFGFIHTQLTGHDDVLSIDYITAGFTDANAVLGSYEIPVGSARDVRLRAYGTYSNFKASDVGFADERFEGDSWSLGAEASVNLFQFSQSFVDVFAGARYQHIRVENQVVSIEGETAFFIPYIGLRYDRSTEKAASAAEVRVETNLADVGTDEDEAQELGRLFVDEEWTVLKWSASHSFYLEPLLFKGAQTRADSPHWQTALAHELAFSIRGQHAFGNRLIPQEEETIGGLYTVRGYPESIVAGDNSVVVSAEYRFHLPRTFAIQEDPTQTPLFGQPFRVSPDQRYGRPDWDLIFRGFVDAGRVTQSDRQAFEENNTLVGAGVGVEFLFKRNLNLRVDWGFALRDARDTDAGESRVHFVGTILY
ncbi:MAG: ShlB/FhaC/HecB family hemolysin secretion/activation protein [Phycisphaerales bacterium]